ncbi:MAG: peptidylprolyl isomerase [Pseudomonadota bacterium]
MAPAPSRPAAVVNDEEIPEAMVARAARRTGWPQDKTLQVLVDATLVIQEAARLGQRCETPEAPEQCAKELLGILYSSENLCKIIPEAEVDLGYQELFDKDWPVEAYAGWVVEIRCCGGDRGDCDTPAAEACRQDLVQWGPPFEALSLAWASGTPVEEGVARIFQGTAPLNSADFFFTYWPESGPEEQPKLESWDPAMLAEIISLPVGEVSKPLRSTMGLHLFRLDRYKPAHLKDDPEVRSRIRERICEGRVAQVRDRYVRDLRSGASIRMD